MGRPTSDGLVSNLLAFETVGILKAEGRWKVDIVRFGRTFVVERLPQQ